MIMAPLFWLRHGLGLVQDRIESGHVHSLSRSRSTQQLIVFKLSAKDCQLAGNKSFGIIAKNKAEQQLCLIPPFLV